MGVELILSNWLILKWIAGELSWLLDVGLVGGVVVLSGSCSCKADMRVLSRGCSCEAGPGEILPQEM